MKQNRVNVALIRLAVEKGIRDIQEDSARGIRNLVDLGEMFSTGQFQKDFFREAQRALEDEGSAYYRLLEQVARDTDAAHLTTFGMGLGYSCMTWGAQLIRALEEREGFNIPWCLRYDMSDGRYLPLETLADAVRQGARTGICCSLVHLDGRYPDFAGLLGLIAAEPDCVFFVFAPPKLTAAALAEIGDLPQNAAFLLDLEAADSASLDRAVRLLKSRRHLFGAATRRAPDYPRCEALGIPFLFLIADEKSRPAGPDGDYESFCKARAALRYPVFSIDLAGDLARIDRNISSEACLVTIDGEGGVRAVNVDRGEVREGLSFPETPLLDILARAMPKKR